MTEQVLGVPYAPMTPPDNNKTPQQMTAAELVEAIKAHREQVRKLLEETRNRRDAEKNKDTQD